MAANNEHDASRTNHAPAWSSQHPVPTIQNYRESKKQSESALEASNGDLDDGDNGSASYQDGGDSNIQTQDQVDTSEATGLAQDPKAKRKEMQRRQPDTSGRTVTDPVTHLPIQIRDYTDDDMKKAENEKNEKNTLSASANQVMQDTLSKVMMQDGEKVRPLTGAEKNKLAASRFGKEFGKGTYIGLGMDDFSKHKIGSDGKRLGMYIDALQNQAHHSDLEETVATPDFENAKKELAGLFVFAIGLALTVIMLSGLAASLFWILALRDYDGHKTQARRVLDGVGLIIAVLLFSTFICSGLKKWFERQSQYIWEDEVEIAEKRHRRMSKNAQQPETTTWLNLLIGAIWPLINPDLFNSIADLLEDVMQASLPKMVRMVSIEDLGQGSEPFRIMGIRWLPKGEASKSISSEKMLGADKKAEDTTNAEAGSSNEKHDEGQDSDTKDGMEAEEGEFVNVEIAFAYRAQARNKELNIKKRNAHLYLAFYLPGHIRLPVWVELRGLVGTMRARLQLTPDPPFIALCTITFLGQPKVDMSCVPLVKKGLNIMDVPLISNFVQSAVDAAMAEYVAPKSLTIDLQSMLTGDDFKRDTTSRGILVVRIKRAFDFKEGDVGVPLLKNGSSDPYVSVGWAKLGKPVWSTRVLINNMHPYWEEQGYMIFGPEELDAGEKLRVQLWDSDRTTADDDLGRVEIDLDELMKNEKSNGKMWERTDTFEAMKAGEEMPGRFDWSVGYFPKVKLLDSQVKEQSSDSNVTTVEELREQVYANATKKLREVASNASAEVQQQKEQDFEAAQVEMISNSLPPEDYPSGIISIQIHQIVGLQLEEANRSRASEGGDPDTGDAEEHTLPDSYCNIILNHQKVFKTRTKPKSSKPFFNACIERYVRDWRSAIIHVSVRDGRIHEDDPLLGVVYLPLAEMLRSRKKSYFNEYFPLAGGVGYGRIRISVVFRSVQLQAPAASLGWDTFGTLEVFPEVEVGKDGLHDEYKKHKLKLRTSLSKASMDYDSHQPGRWAGKTEEPITLAVRKRHSSNVVFELSGPATFFGGHNAPSFAVLWLQDIPDEQEQTLDLPVYTGDMERAEANKLPESEMGKKVGSLSVTLWFSRGLNRAHRKLASDNKNLADVMEVLDVTEDTSFNMNDYNGDDEDDSDEERGPSRAADDNKENEGEKNPLNPVGIVNEVKNYKKDKKQLHSRHKGIMQWKGPRTLKWMKGKGEQMMNKVGGTFEHGDREPGIETEA